MKKNILFELIAWGGLLAGLGSEGYVLYKSNIDKLTNKDKIIGWTGITTLTGCYFYGLNKIEDNKSTKLEKILK
jgi:hypothetical protein